MNMREYQQAAIKTAVYPNRHDFLGLMYVALKLNGEAGEIAEKVGKIYRDKSCVIGPADMKDLIKEIGDVLWYVAAMADELGIVMDVIADVNLMKLQDRVARNAIHGSGDNR